MGGRVSEFNLQPIDIYDMIVGDFRALWDATARTSSSKYHGNFMFAGQSMVLLEFISRYCSFDPANQALGDFSNALNQVETKYFKSVNN